MSDLGHRFTIKELPLEVRPRERLSHYGAANLSDPELLAIVIGTGTKNESALHLSERILSQFETLGALSQASLEELSNVNGIGAAKSAKVLASIELGRRLILAPPTQRITISSPPDIVKLLMSEMRYFDRECFKAVILNTKNEIIKILDVSIGSLNSSVVHPRELYKFVIKHNGAALIVAHNHPSGNPAPSSEDIKLTKRLNEAGEILGIELLDHIILGDGNFVSLKEEGLF